MVPRHKLPTAMAIYNGGVSIGSGFTSIIVGMLLGWLGGKVFTVFGMALHDWQMVFLIIGTPGVVVGLAFLLTVREPPRRGRATTMRLPILDVFRFLWRERPIYLPFIVGSALLQIESFGVLGWRFPFFSHVRLGSGLLRPAVRLRDAGPHTDRLGARSLAGPEVGAARRHGSDGQALDPRFVPQLAPDARHAAGAQSMGGIWPVMPVHRRHRHFRAGRGRRAAERHA